ncbi:primase C-terminal domain-containing protein, partial [Citrobacter freundii]
DYEQWLRACYERANAYNLQFAAPLDENEVNGIAKSIAKWTKSKFSEETFGAYVSRTHSSEIQSVRGKKSRGGGRPKGRISIASDASLKPWVNLNISRSKYYRLGMNKRFL